MERMLAGNDEDYNIYNDTLNTAMTEIRKSKCSYEQTFARSNKLQQWLCAFVGNKHNICDKVRRTINEWTNKLFTGTYCEKASRVIDVKIGI